MTLDTAARTLYAPTIGIPATSNSIEHITLISACTVLKIDISTREVINVFAVMVKEAPGPNKTTPMLSILGLVRQEWTDIS